MDIKTPPSVEVMQKIQENSAKLLELAEKKFGIRLDYSEEALVVGDDLLTLFFKNHRGHFYSASLMIGSFLGEMIIKNLDGKWRHDLLIRKVGKTKALINPIMKAKKRLENGLIDSLVFYYRDLKIITGGDTDFATDTKKIENWHKKLRKGKWDKVLLERMFDPEEKKYVREEAADILGRIGDKSVVPELVAALEKPDNAYYACLTLQSISDPKALESLLNLLKKTRSNPLKHQVILALGALKDKSVVPYLAKILSNKDDLTAYYAAISLGQIGGDEAIQTALDILGGFKKGNRVHAILILEGSSDPKAVPALIEALFCRDEEVREAAARAFQFIPDEGAVKPLINLLDEASPRLRIYAAYALAHLGKQFLPAIQKILKDSVPMVRSHAERITYWLEKGISPAKCI